MEHLQLNFRRPFLSRRRHHFDHLRQITPLSPHPPHDGGDDDGGYRDRDDGDDYGDVHGGDHGGGDHDDDVEDDDSLPMFCEFEGVALHPNPIST